MVSEVEQLRQRLREVLDVIARNHPAHEIPPDKPCEMCSLIYNLEYELKVNAGGGK